MKTIMKKTALLLFVSFLLFSCDKEVKTELIPQNCDYTFLGAESNSTGTTGVPQEITINLEVPQNNTCQTNYQMYYTTERNGNIVTDGLLTYQNTNFEENANNIFDVENHSFNVYYSNNQYGIYKITFYISNPNASVPNQTKEVIFELFDPALDVTPLSLISSVRVLETTSYNYQINNGTGEYGITIMYESGDDLNPNIRINNTTTNLGDAVNVNNNTFNIEIIPTEIGTATYKIIMTDLNSGIISNIMINTTSTQPTFVFNNVSLVSNNIWQDDEIILNVSIDNLGYNQNISYTYEYGVTNYTNSITENGLSPSGIPPAQTFVMNPTNPGVYNIVLKVTNQYNYVQTFQAEITIQSIAPSFDSFNINHLSSTICNSYEYDEYSDTTEKDKYYKYTKIDFNNFITGRYAIQEINISVTSHYRPYASNNFQSYSLDKTQTFNNNFNNSVTVPLRSTFPVYSNGDNYEIVSGMDNSCASGNSSNHSFYPGGFRNLDYPLDSPSMQTTLYIRIKDTENNIFVYTKTLDNGWGAYTL